MKAADAVWLVSHEATAGDVEVDKAGHELPYPALLVRGRPNEAIIKEKRLIKGAELAELIKILGRPFRDHSTVSSQCFTPHHALFIRKGSRTSYVDSCFGCHVYNSSRDLWPVLENFDARRWRELQAYFKCKGFIYGFNLPDN